MSATTLPQKPARPTRAARPVPATPSEPIRTAEQARRYRINKAYRVYLESRYEWTRLRAVDAGYITPSEHTPLPLKEGEKLEEIQAKLKVLDGWLARNVGGATPQEVAPQAATDAPAHVREFLDLATQHGLSHAKEHRPVRLAKINAFLMDNEKEPVESIRSIREEDMPLLKAGLQKRYLRWK